MSITAHGPGGRNGMPERKPYRYRGNGTAMSDAEVQQHLAGIRARLALDAAEAIDGPSPEWHREAKQAITDLAIVPRPGPRARRYCPDCHFMDDSDSHRLACGDGNPVTGRALPPRPSLATSREARAAVPVPTVIRLRPVTEPVSADGQRPFWVRPVPPSLAARLAIPTRPMPPAPPKRCRRCGYLKTRCTCGKGGA